MIPDGPDPVSTLQRLRNNGSAPSTNNSVPASLGLADGIDPATTAARLRAAARGEPIPPVVPVSPVVADGSDPAETAAKLRAAAKKPNIADMPTLIPDMEARPKSIAPPTPGVAQPQFGGMPFGNQQPMGYDPMYGGAMGGYTDPAAMMGGYNDPASYAMGYGFDQIQFQQMLQDPMYQQMLSDPGYQQMLMDPAWAQMMQDPSYQMQMFQQFQFQNASYNGYYGSASATPDPAPVVRTGPAVPTMIEEAEFVPAAVKALPINTAIEEAEFITPLTPMQGITEAAEGHEGFAGAPPPPPQPQ
jgi:hypothetical protein